MSTHALEDLLVAIASQCEGDLDQAEELLEGALTATGLPVKASYGDEELAQLAEAWAAKGLRTMAKAPDDELAQAGAAVVRSLIEALPAQA